MKPLWRYASVLFVLAVLLAACKPQPAKQGDAAKYLPLDGYFKTHFQDECQFIVEAIASDLAEMAAFARDKKVPVSTELEVSANEHIDSEFGHPVYDVQIISGKGQPPLQKTLDVNKPIWLPELYDELAKAIMSGLTASSRSGDSNDLALLVKLTDIRPATIEGENQKLSRQLEQNFGDPTLHEMAALLVGVFALREHSEHFYDVRSQLCRMTAHLSFARTLSNGGAHGVNGRVAEAILFTLMNNQKEALAKIAAFEGPVELTPWVRALRARNTRDYRELAGIADQTLLERTMQFLAISRSINSDAGWLKLGPQRIRQTSDFTRIANGAGYSVGVGHQLRELSLPHEMREIVEVCTLSRGKAPAKDQMIIALNELPERCFTRTANGVEVRVIGWGQWAMFLQRHLCHTLEHNFEFLHRKWGVPDMAKEFDNEITKAFGGLRLYPFVAKYNCTTTNAYHKAVEAGLPVTVATPHLVSPEIWNSICNSTYFASRYIPIPNPHINEWHRHNPPPGTAYNPRARLYHPSLVDRPDAPAFIEQLYSRAPHDRDLAEWVVKLKYNKKATFDQTEEIFRPVLDYSMHQNYVLAQMVTNDPPRYEKVMLKYSSMESSGYLLLGRYFAYRNQDEKAAGYYEKGIELSTDEVSVAGRCGWLVHYYFHKGEVKKAEALANRAAETYSYDGLKTKAELLEVQEKDLEAYDYYWKMEERYNDGWPLAAFCIRYKTKTGDPRFDKEVQKRLKLLFPRGLEKVTPKSFKGIPDEGVMVYTENELVLQAGLKKGDIIVGLDGLKVYAMMQYQYLREKTTNAPLDLIVWNGREYVEIKANPPNRRFKANFDDYRRPTQ
jgi:tetratricopeptide (TPR) repeat protein